MQNLKNLAKKSIKLLKILREKLNIYFKITGRYSIGLSKIPVPIVPENHEQSFRNQATHSYPHW